MSCPGVWVNWKQLSMIMSKSKSPRDSGSFCNGQQQAMFYSNKSCGYTYRYSCLPNICISCHVQHLYTVLCICYHVQRLLFICCCRYTCQIGWDSSRFWCRHAGHDWYDTMDIYLLKRAEIYEKSCNGTSMYKQAVFKGIGDDWFGSSQGKTFQRTRVRGRR